MYLQANVHYHAHYPHNHMVTPTSFFLFIWHNIQIGWSYTMILLILTVSVCSLIWPFIIMISSLLPILAHCFQMLPPFTIKEGLWGFNICTQNYSPYFPNFIYKYRQVCTHKCVSRVPNFDSQDGRDTSLSKQKIQMTVNVTQWYFSHKLQINLL